MAHFSLFRRSGKNIKLLYYLRNFVRWMIPKYFYQRRLTAVLTEARKRADWAYIEERVAYYNRLPAQSLLPTDTPTLREYKRRKMKSVYFFDSYEYTRWFADRLRCKIVAGDTNYFVPAPSIVKARPLSDTDTNSVLLNMDKVRHFIFLNDRKAWRNKLDKAIFRGGTSDREPRKRFIELYHDHPFCTAGDTDRPPQSIPASPLTLYQHLDYKFIMSLEGIDVASNLKWVMSSNSIAVMPPPTCETWFMEGRLIPNYHYIAIRPDFSDLEERLRYYLAHPEEAETIIQHAHEYVRQFWDKEREDIISLLVLEKYFKQTGQEV